ncbi:hypothetical protein C7S18_10270 [Ahniella affigens]|uniref:Uncharacterized protein n=1 Tax=Ahniella affigens TaxID=2021234 RepID=A0A2P1PRS9_9GAMM|nr:hypothetical protein [Ahniella affigens]AVP97556.1 hypothetical protein C7S18_10270 [Ahniella affigens]
MANEIDRWVSHDPANFTMVFKPVILSSNIKQAGLRPYHPKVGIDGPCNFRLKRADHDDVAVVEVLGNASKWDDKFKAVLTSLRFKVVNPGTDEEFLEDDVVAGGAANAMEGWKVIRWTIEETGWDLESEARRLMTLTDRIYWENTATGEKGFSSYVWKPYIKPK